MYLTYLSKLQNQQLTIENIFGKSLEDIIKLDCNDKLQRTTTVNLELTAIRTSRLRGKYNITQMEDYIGRLDEKAEEFYNQPRESLYHSFRIPKRAGGFREINAPNDEFNSFLRHMLNIFQYKLYILAHDAAYAYVKGRSTVDAVKQHQKNKSRWFLKVDIKDFFPSCTLEFMMTQLRQLFPFNLMQENTLDSLSRLIELCTLKGGLPQGSPMSPLLTNCIMIPYDQKIREVLYNDKNFFVYTRYADDLIISSRYKFNPDHVSKELIGEVLKGTPFKIKDEKTRFGSSAGRNWNLGLMLNQDNNITIGWKAKERFRAATNNFFNPGAIWELDEVNHYLGLVSYYNNVQRKMVEDIIRKNEKKFNISFKSVKKFRLDV